MKTSFQKYRPGLTLVELLVVIAIMGLLTALVVPQVRLVNKDRNIREAARVVGTALVQARDRAVATGAAGLMIERNTNLFDGDNAYYGGTRLYLMRKVPNYEDESGKASVSLDPSNVSHVRIELPYGWTNDFIQRGDRVRLNYGSIRYPITNVTVVSLGPGIPGGALDLSIGLSGGILPRPRNGNDIPFVIERAPRKIESSRVDLPDGYIIDLRYSGYWSGTTTDFAVVGDQQPIEMNFNRDGSLDRLTVASVNGGRPYMARGAIDLFVTEYRPDDANLVGVPAAQAILGNPASLWVTLSDQTGGVNIGYNSPPTSGIDVQSLIIGARQTSRGRTSANQ